jgi:hypothetical protein
MIALPLKLVHPDDPPLGVGAQPQRQTVAR